MLRFTKLKLTGFKSFVEGTDLQIELGLTGIVGPNGCGKSNLVEALRWVMGETSAKKMRGGEMDDVIFGGTNDRPPRNVAEVILSLDNTERSAPAQFNDAEEIEVSRRIEREKGSIYKVNGHDVRARDVQLLFADSATGARSTALVSQGRIGAVIAAKPSERRLLLEEAAGITGLHSRRHEAELRLRGAETNLERLDDILVTLEAQLQNLKKQARQATRYRNLSDHIRKAEATLFYLRWTAAEAELEKAERELAAMEAVVRERTGTAGAAATAQAEVAALMPERRQAEAEAAAELQRLTLARDGLDAEEQRIAAMRADYQGRLEQTAGDRAREEAQINDAAAALERLTSERAAIGEPDADDENARAEAGEKLAEANAAVDGLDAQLTGLTDRVAATEARRATLSHRVEDLRSRRRQLTARLDEITSQHRRVESEAPDLESLPSAEDTLADARRALDDTRAGAEAATQALAEASEKTEAQRAGAEAQRQAATELRAEVQALAEVSGGDAAEWPPVIESLSVEAGYEAALAVALGDDLTASADEAAPSHWRALGPLAGAPALPEGAVALARYVTGPAALERRLSQIGVVADDAEGARLAPALAQGQRLVSRSGALWRWDGLRIASSAADAARARLRQRKRLAEGREKLAEADAAAELADGRLAAARAAEAEARAAERAAREAVAAADALYARTRDRVTDIKERSAGHVTHLQALGNQRAAITSDLEQIEQADAEARRELDGLPDPAGERREIERLRAELTERRAEQVECRSRFDTLERAHAERTRRLAAIETETESWTARRDDAKAQIEALDERRGTIEAELERLARQPQEIAAQRTTLMAAIEDAEARRTSLADTLAETETRLAEADKALRAAEAALHEARENMVRAEGAVVQARQACTGIAERVGDRLECRPDQLFEISGLNPDKDLPELEAVERKVERLLRERETMGPVNLRAEQEAEEMKEQMDTLTSEREDLTRAIDKLRRGIAELNREGRQRLLKSFEEVNSHFQQLFVRLFGGGRAHLELIEADDPLEAGLEIMASPPGKRLQVLSLLSGGEQALTAIALLFAVFQTNPAPICVLDEVDAPLDDANVDRFCSMLEDMAKTDQTRFIVITHHRMTMARMDRLFGVTMSERGVSQLVSVDLRRAEELRATA